MLRPPLLLARGFAALSLLLVSAQEFVPPVASAAAPIDLPRQVHGVASFPVGINVMGENGAGDPDPSGEFVVTTTPVFQVTLDFSKCGDFRLCENPLDADATVNCVIAMVTKSADALGEAKFRVVGCEIPALEPVEPQCVGVYVNGDHVGSVSLGVVDLTGCNGLNPADLAAWLFGFYSTGGLYRDYDHSGTLGPADLSIWLTVFFNGGSVSSRGPAGRCP